MKATETPAASSCAAWASVGPEPSETTAVAGPAASTASALKAWPDWAILGTSGRVGNLSTKARYMSGLMRLTSPLHAASSDTGSGWISDRAIR